MVMKLLEYGASPNVCDSNCNTPLHYLVSYGYFGTDERLFILDNESTFSFSNGMSTVV